MLAHSQQTDPRNSPSSNTYPRLTERVYHSGHGWSGRQEFIARCGAACVEEYLRSEARWDDDCTRQDDFYKRVARNMGHEGMYHSQRSIAHWVGCYIDAYHDTTTTGVLAYIGWTHDDWLDWAFDMITEE